MKKQYIQPEMTAVTIKTVNMLCGSITQSGDNLNVTLDDGEGNFGDDNTINSRRGSFWNDED